MDANERYEKLASLFFSETGIIAPGKDAGAMGNHNTREERKLAWECWNTARQQALEEAVKVVEKLRDEAIVKCAEAEDQGNGKGQEEQYDYSEAFDVAIKVIRELKGGKDE